MNILFLTSRVPCHPVGGIQLRTFNFIKALSRRHAITLLSLAEQPVPPRQLEELKRYVRRLEVIVLPRYRSFLNCLAGLFSSTPLQVHYYKSSMLHQRLQEMAGREKFDLIYFHLIRMAEYAASLNGEPKILDLTDAMSLNCERTCQIHREYPLRLFQVAQKIESRRLRQYEAAAIQRFDRNLIVSRSDRNFIGQFADVSSMEIVGQGVNLEYFRFYDGDYDASQIVFLGTMSFLPNQDAVLYFYEKIWPLVKRRQPKMKLQIVGANPTPEVLKLQRHPDVQITGAVPDVRPYLRRAAVSICPMRVGSGVKGKVFESMALGTPVVSTSLGVEGLDVRQGHELFIADAPEDFARRVCQLSRDSQLRALMARRARYLIEKKYNWDFVAQPLENIVASLEKQAGQGKPAKRKLKLIGVD